MIAALSFNRPAMHASGVFPIPASYDLSIVGERLYDAWGGARAGQSHGFPNHRYCANLGHVADDETGLTYMRARYYEPSTGRFISQDPIMEGRNWYGYCGNDPVSFSDPQGTSRVRAQLLSVASCAFAVAGVLQIFSALTTVFCKASTPAQIAAAIKQAQIGVFMLGAGAASNSLDGDFSNLATFAADGASMWALGKIGSLTSQILLQGGLLKFTAASALSMAVTAYSLILLGFLAANMIEEFK